MYIVVWLKFILFFMSSNILYFMTAYWLIRNLCIWKIKAYTHVRLLVLFFLWRIEKKECPVYDRKQFVLQTSLLECSWKGGRLHIVCKLNRFIWPSVLVRKALDIWFQKNEKNKNFKYEKGGNYTNFHFINDLFKFELFMG